ncbi:MAG: porin family protein [Cyclobacteriaceae bacterium]|nr:MAG: porin family protein [Cyclobacteriaceae bacterium]
MKKVVLTMFVACCAVASFAQGRFSVGPEVALPMGDFADAVGLGIGGTVRYEAPISGNLNWTATAGFLSFMKETAETPFGDVETSATAIPIQGGIKYYFTESFNGFYAAGELGVHLYKVKAELAGESDDASETEFSFAPGVGYHLGSIDIAARYQIAGDGDYLGFRIAYVFGGK